MTEAETGGSQSPQELRLPRRLSRRRLAGAHGATPSPLTTARRAMSPALPQRVPETGSASREPSPGWAGLPALPPTLLSVTVRHG